MNPHSPNIPILLVMIFMLVGSCNPEKFSSKIPYVYQPMMNVHLPNWDKHQEVCSSDLFRGALGGG